MIEFRVYYNDTGSIVCYTCEDLPGTYIVISKEEYAMGNPFMRVVDGKLVGQHEFTIVSKLEKSTKGISCAKEDVCIISDNEAIQWELKTHEFRNS